MGVQEWPMMVELLPAYVNLEWVLNLGSLIFEAFALSQT